MMIFFPGEQKKAGVRSITGIHNTSEMVGTFFYFFIRGDVGKKKCLTCNIKEKKKKKKAWVM